MSSTLVPDYHLHGQFSRDSSASLRGYCEYALKMGIKELAVTEHLTLFDKDKNYGCFDYPSFMEEVENCRLLFKGKIIIKAGIEVDYHPYLEEEIKRKISGWNELDLVIGSVHYVKGRSVVKSKISRAEVRPFIEDYLQIVQRMISSGIYSVVGHFDVFRRCLTENFDIEPHLTTVQKVLRQAVVNDMALEINTSGFKHGLNDTFPNYKIIKIFKDCGGKYITIGSDAHHVKELAAGQEKGIAAAILAGFHHISCFRKRKPYLVSLQP